MMLHIDILEPEVRAFCRRWHVSESALFGSSIREGFRPDSDVDELVRFHSNAHPTLFDLHS